jgi:pimeloyl-ACP methyl ester carboxylesterase
MELYFEDTGSQKPALVLLAGLATDETSWIFQKEPLAAQHRLITCDNRGAGRSPKPAGPYAIAQMAADVIALLDRLGLAKASLLGHSMGGAIAQYLAIEHPERVDRLVLACTSSKFDGRSVPVVRSWAGVIQLGASPEVIGNTLFPWLYTERFLSTPSNLEACISALAQHPYPMQGRAVAAQVAALGDFDGTAQLHRIASPTLVLAAEQDLLVSPTSCRRLAESISGARLEVLPETAHSCMLETPELFNRAALSFLASPA